METENQIKLPESYVYFFHASFSKDIPLITKEKSLVYFDVITKEVQLINIAGFFPLVKIDKNDNYQISTGNINMEPDLGFELSNICAPDIICNLTVFDLAYKFNRYLPIAYTSNFELLCLGVGADNQGKVFLCQNDNNQIQNNEAPFLDRYARIPCFIHIADSFAAVNENLVSPQIINRVRLDEINEAIDLQGDFDSMSLDEQLTHLSKIAMEIYDNKMIEEYDDSSQNDTAILHLIYKNSIKVYA